MKIKTIFLISILSLAAFLIGCSKASPVRTKENALLAYQKILNDSPAIEGEHDELYDASFDYDQNMKIFGNHYDQFAVIDINKDEIPELITLSVVNFRWTPVSVFTFTDNIVLLKNPLDLEAHGTFEQMSIANGAYTTYICEEGHIHNVWRGTTPLGEEAEENFAYSFDGDSLTSVDCSAPENENTIYFSDIAKANTAENVAAIIPN